MIAICAVVWVHVCIPQKYLHAADLFVMYTHDRPLLASEVERLGVQINVYGSDNLQYFGTAGANRVCKEDRCIYYRKHCDSDGKVCEYAGGFDSAGTPWTTDGWSMKITAKSSGALHRAEKALSLNLSSYDGNSGIFVPLSALWIESATTELGYCKQGVRMQGCMTPEQWRRIRLGHD